MDFQYGAAHGTSGHGTRGSVSAMAAKFEKRDEQLDFSNVSS